MELRKKGMPTVCSDSNRHVVRGLQATVHQNNSFYLCLEPTIRDSKILRKRIRVRPHCKSRLSELLARSLCVTFAAEPDKVWRSKFNSWNRREPIFEKKIPRRSGIPSAVYPVDTAEKQKIVSSARWKTDRRPLYCHWLKNMCTREAPSCLMSGVLTSRSSTFRVSSNIWQWTTVSSSSTQRLERILKGSKVLGGPLSTETKKSVVRA